MIVSENEQLRSHVETLDRDLQKANRAISKSKKVKVRKVSES